jgi:UDP-N-acetylmuramyl pentapeptide phosphotransferase/UDP-N-acetylglucosamine-1-phosphate transferase
LLCVIGLALLGWVDDIKDLGARSRLLAQCVAGLLVGSIVVPKDSAWSLIGVLAASVLAMVFTVNTINFMDGINGITAMTVAAWGAIVWIAGSRATAPTATFAGAVAMGTALAFLPFNAPRARLFLGDVGSYLYGALVASTVIVISAAGVAPLVAIAPLVPFAADVLGTLLRRARGGKNLTAAHREHAYQQLVHISGHRHVTVSALYGVGALMCGALALVAPVPVTMIGLTLVALAVVTLPEFVQSGETA